MTSAGNHKLRSLGLTAMVVFSIFASVAVVPGVASAANQPGEVRSVEQGGAVFLGGDNFELGIGPDGGFGDFAPSSFFGSDRGEIGMYADIDGFYNDSEDYRYDYFLPGSPEERFSVGYDDGTQRTASNGNNEGENMPTTLTEDSTDSRAAVEVNSSFDGDSDGNDELQVDQEYSFDPTERYYKTTVTLTNTAGEPLEDVRYQRSFDPDNAQDLGCTYTTNNTVVEQPPANDEAIVKAQVRDSDSCGVTDISDIPIFYYSDDSAARVSTGASSSGLEPSPVVYAPEDYDEPQPAGTNKVEDTYIAITLEESTLEAGESTTFTFYTGLTDDIDTTLGNVRDETGSSSSTESSSKSMEEKAEEQDSEPPVADAGSDFVVEEDDLVDFDGSNSSDDFAIKWYLWDFTSDNDTDYFGVTATERYEDPGIYRARLTVVDYLDRRDADTRTVTVVNRGGPAADAGDDKQTSVGKTVQFNANGTSYNETVTGYAWDFDGDGTTDNSGARTAHAFGTPGEHTVELTVTDAAGNTDTDTVSVEVIDRTAPTADLEGPTAAPVNDTVTFDASSSTDNVGVTNYSWDIGGDETMDASGARTTMGFPAPGEYPIELTVTDAAGNTDSVTVTISVVDETAPTARLDGPTQVFVDETVTFEANGSTDNVGVRNYSWDFDGDGTPEATGRVVSHAFESAGEQRVTVMISDAAGNTDTANRTVTVQSDATTTPSPTRTPETSSETEGTTEGPTEDQATTVQPDTTSTNREASTDTEASETTSGAGPGFDPVITLLALVVVTFGAIRKRERR